MAAAGKAAAGRPKMGEEKLIIRSEKVRLFDILSMMILRRPITSYAFVDVGDETARDIGITPGDIFVKLTEIIQKVLASIYTPAKWLGIVVELFLNFVALNGGLLGILWNIVRFKLVIPRRDAANFRTMIGMIDGRTELKPAPETSAGDMRQLQVLNVLVSGEVADLESGYVTDGTPLIVRTYLILEITVMAAKIAYENAAFVENVVNNVWKFNFVGFYNGWNKFLKEETTQALVFTDRPEDANVVVVAFRGTEPFNMQDWSTDVNLSWLGMGAMGHVHAGFLKALGLQEEDGKDASRAFPKDAPNGAAPIGKTIAYYKLREVIREQLKKHPASRLVITGHSLGGALAAVFPAILALHKETDILTRLDTVQTYGQPRVGDDTFAKYLAAEVAKVAATYYRIVYRYDVVPRVPFDIPLIAEFAHGGTCIYYDGWYDGKVLPGDAPNPNYFDPRFLLSMYGNALGDLVKGAFLWVRAGKDYREGPVSLLYRASGLIVPGLASHSPRDYVNGIRLGRIEAKQV
ncbi:hypothetical protein QYE76_009602 [Lolium multiflorum]|uniref:Fungal lipase-type domain-containing protein n=1 Tax=Lolium multiflorum TaxID=4521 RepID=A0AAD8TS77_LOLMU|nr:hypothetical protein QYE76_009602 [Lolium multiflorum]